jgi:membrane-bound serine protease (ClpP class)
MVAMKRPFATGEEHLVGVQGDVRSRLDPIGQVWIEGALWRARAADLEEPIEAGYRVRVEAVDGLTLTVAPLGHGSQEQVADATGSEPEGS